MKRCTKCGESKDAAEFPRNERCIGRLSSWCRDCHLRASRAWRDKQRERREQAERERMARIVAGLREQTEARRAAGFG
jgi:hypothetical protein